MGKIHVVARDEFEVENLEEVREKLHKLGLSIFELVSAMRGQTYMGEMQRPFYVFSYDASDPEDGYVATPEFYIDSDDYHEGDRPINWTWTDGDQYLENWKLLVSLRKDPWNGVDRITPG
jgi:hypothetical protein